MVRSMAMDNFQFVYELNRAVTSLNSYIDARIGPHAGITRAQFVALLLIGRSPDLTRAELARQLSCSHVAAGRLVSILADKEYISDIPSKQNPHIVHLKVTEAGENMIAYVQEGFRQESASLFSQMSDKVDIVSLTKQLHIVADILSTYR